MKNVHTLLKRQLRKSFGPSYQIPPEWYGFIEKVNAAYHEFDLDRNMLERSLELSSQELLQTNSELRAVFEAIPDLFFRLDSDGRILDCKAGNTADLYVPRQQIIGCRIDKTPLKSLSADFTGALQRVKTTGKTVRIEYSLSLDGTEQYYEARFMPLPDNEIVAVIRNVTEGKRAEKTIREGEQRYRSIFENSPQGIFRATPDGVLVDANPTLVSMLCYESREEFLETFARRGDSIFTMSDFHSGFKTLVEEQGSVEGFEMQILCKDGSRIWVSVNAHVVKDAEGQTTYHEGTVENITERKNAAEALLESEEKYRSIVEESHVGVYIVQDDLFRFVNTRFCEIHGYSYSELVDRMSPKDLVLVEDTPAMGKNVDTAEHGDGSSSGMNYRIRRKDGEIRMVQATGSPIFYQRRPAIIGTLLDVTKEKVLEQQLLESQKLETVGRLAGGIAHDFNNMLGVILGNTQLAKARTAVGEKIHEYCCAIEKATFRAADFTRQLLAFSRRQTLNLKALDLNDLVSNFEKMVHHVIGEHIDINILCRPKLSPVRADDGQINQVLLNLVVNACESMPHGGTLTIETSEAYIDNVPPDALEAEAGQYIVLSVTDTGAGMKRETINKIFEPFFTTKKGGNGLGLSVVYGIIKQHGGFITVGSEVGKGTVFKVCFPSMEGHKGKRAAKEGLLLRGKETILLVEDDEEFRRIGLETLQSLGYQVLSAHDGHEGLRLFSERAHEIDLVILDVLMPKMNGRAVLEEMRKIRPSIPSLFVTGYSLNSSHVSHIIREGLDALQKPYSFNDLSKKIREILERRRSVPPEVLCETNMYN